LKYSLILILVTAAAIWFPLPEANANAEQSQEIGVKIDSTIKVERKDWDEIVSEQLKRREEQLLEAARIKAVEEAKKAEQAKVVQTPKPVQKVAQKAPIVARIVSYANTYSPGYCTWFVASRRPVPSGWGNARNWLANARAAGFATGSVPQVGAIAWTGAGAMGHVGLVTGVNGSQVTITDMNYAGFNVISTRVANASEFSYIY
jgi:surface antigen